jgi:hypothetical protein
METEELWQNLVTIYSEDRWKTMQSADNGEESKAFFLFLLWHHRSSAI